MGKINPKINCGNDLFSIIARNAEFFKGKEE
jgi:hypothetical protein